MPYPQTSSRAALSIGAPRENLAAARRFWDELGQGAAQNQGASVLLDGYVGERLRIATLRHQPHVFSSERLPRQHRHAALLTLQLEGEASIEQMGRRNTIMPGDFCLVDLSRPFRIEAGRSLVQTAYLPLSALRDALPRLEQIAAMGLHAHLAPVGFLRSLFRDIFERTGDLSEPVADRLVDVLPQMLAVAAESVADTVPPPSQMRQHHKQQVRRFAREHLADSSLCAEMIGKGVGLSTSYLFELFADEELTLMRWVRSERLARCKRELAEPSLRFRSIAHIAQAWGFGDMTHFSRSFREAFGMSPRTWRQEARLQKHTDVHTSKETPSDRVLSPTVVTVA